MTVLRHLLAIALLPAVVVVLVPWWILSGRLAPGGLRDSAAGTMVLPSLLGILLFLAGFALFAWCVWLFARVGRGTLAPWDATRRLVVRGPYRHVRNPMITGVAAMLAGEALLFRSEWLAGWLLLFVVINHAYFIAIEEPGLERRFGGEYVAYRSAVPRWLPRWHAWRTGDAEPDAGSREGS